MLYYFTFFNFFYFLTFFFLNYILIFLHTILFYILYSSSFYPNPYTNSYLQFPTLYTFTLTLTLPFYYLHPLYTPFTLHSLTSLPNTFLLSYPFPPLYFPVPLYSHFITSLILIIIITLYSFYILHYHLPIPTTLPSNYCYLSSPNLIIYI